MRRAIQSLTLSTMVLSVLGAGCRYDQGTEEMASAYGLDKTRHAVEEIESVEIRRDFLRLVEGAEQGIRHRDRNLAAGLMRNIAAATIALNQTLTPPVAIALLDALWEDTARRERTFLRKALGFEKENERICDIEPGTPIGSSHCRASVVCTCYTLPDTAGCAVVCDEVDGLQARFLFVWEAAR